MKSHLGMTKVYHPYTPQRGGGEITTNKVEIKYTFVNPNKTKEFEKTLRQIIFEKLLSMDMRPIPIAEKSFGN